MIFIFIFLLHNIIYSEEVIDKYLLITTEKLNDKNMMINIQSTEHAIDNNFFVTQCDEDIVGEFYLYTDLKGYDEKKQFDIKPQIIYTSIPIVTLQGKQLPVLMKCIYIFFKNKDKKNCIKFNKKAICYFDLAQCDYSCTIEKSSHYNMLYNQLYLLNIKDYKYNKIYTKDQLDDVMIQEDLKNNFPFIIFDKKTTVFIDGTDAVYTQRNFNDNTTAYQVEDCYNTSLTFNSGDRLFIHKNLLIQIDKGVNIERFQKIPYFKSSKDVIFNELLNKYTFEKDKNTRCTINSVDSLLMVNNTSDFTDTVIEKILQNSFFIIPTEKAITLKVTGTNALYVYNSIQNKYEVLDCTRSIVLNKNDILFLHKDVNIQAVDRDNSVFFSKEIIFNNNYEFIIYVLRKNNSYCWKYDITLPFIKFNNNSVIKLIKDPAFQEDSIGISIIKNNAIETLQYTFNTPLTFNAGDQLFINTNENQPLLNTLCIITDNNYMSISYPNHVSNYICPCFLANKEYQINLVGPSPIRYYEHRYYDNSAYHDSTQDYPIITILDADLLILDNIQLLKYDSNLEKYSMVGPRVYLYSGDKFVLHQNILIPRRDGSNNKFITYRTFNNIDDYKVEFKQ